MTKHGPVWTGKVRLVPELLDAPLHWKKPRRIFVNSMSDLFHEAAPFEFIDVVFQTMAISSRHIYQVLTKRPERMSEYCSRLGSEAWGRYLPLPNVHLGISVEDQETYDERWRYLRDTPAAVRFVSYEPALGPLDLGKRLLKPDWVICGGESGPRARPMEEEWARSIMQQCKRAGVPFFMKQGSQANWKDFKSFESFPEDLRIREFPKGAT